MTKVIYHHTHHQFIIPIRDKYPACHFLDPPQTGTHQPEVYHLERTEVDFSEGQFEKEIETNFPCHEQEHYRPTEKHYRDSPVLRTQIKTSDVVHRFCLNKQT